MSSKNIIESFVLFFSRIFTALIAFTLLVVIALHSFVYSIPSYSYNNDTINPRVNIPLNSQKDIDNKINLCLKDMNLDGAYYEKFEINDQYINVFITLNDNNYRSFILDRKTSQKVQIEKIIIEDQVENFNALINHYLNQKYPYFIVSSLNENIDVAYHITQDKIKIYYYNFVSVPAYSGELSIVLNKEDMNDKVIYEMENSEQIEENIIPLDPNKPIIALTFDDGPGDLSLDLINTLYNNKANATFFILGNRINNYSDVILKGIEYGNEYGSHSYSHPYLTKIRMDKADYQIDETNRLFKALIGEDLRLIRPPYGSFNSKILNRYEMAYIMWSIDTLDWKYRDAIYLKNYVLENISDGDIVLFHDIHLTSIEAIKLILPELYVRGFQVTTVSKLAELKGYTIENKQVYKSFK